MKFLVDNQLSPKIARSEQEGRIIVTADTDFGTLLTVQGKAKPSVILLRLPRIRVPQQQLNIILKNLPALEEDLDKGSLVVIEVDRIRVCDLLSNDESNGSWIREPGSKGDGHA